MIRSGVSVVGTIVARVPDWAIVAVFSALIVAETATSVAGKSLTIDEPPHLVSGYLRLTAGEPLVQTEHNPPLIKMMAALPLLAMDVKLPPRPKRQDLRSRLQFAHDFLYRWNDADRLALAGRLAVLPLTLLLGAFVFLWARELFGRAAATFSLFLYSLEPNILAHGPLMNTDLGVSCLLFVTMYFLSRAMEGVTLLLVAGAGLAYGAAMVTKYTAVWAVPWFVLLGVVAVAAERPLTVRLPGRAPVTATTWIRKSLVLVGVLLAVAALAYLVIWGVYRSWFEGGTVPGYGYPGSAEDSRPGQSVTAPLIRWARDWRLLPAAYLDGLSAAGGDLRRWAFLMGEVSTDGWVHYFVVTMLLKTPLPLLIFLGLTPLSLRALWEKAPLKLLALVAPPVLYVGLASVGRMNIGHRHLLPIHPFLFVLAGSLVPWGLRQRRVVRGAMAGLAVW
ncbi:MAG: glycosyltransferase family 39 protein, partial [Gemmatimonadales bacterium]